MNQTDAAATAPSETQWSGWTPGHLAAGVVGALLMLLAAVLIAAGGTVLWADRTQRDAGYVTSDLQDFSTSGSALVTVPTELGSTGTGWLYSPRALGDVRIRVTRAGSGSPLFVGIGRSADVDRYLAGVQHTVITEFWQHETDTVGGGDTLPSAPGGQDFWVASTSGAGTQTLEWEPSNGSWKVVAMNADGRPALDVEADLGARLSALPWIGLGVLAAGALFLTGGLFLIVGALRRRKEV